MTQIPAALLDDAALFDRLAGIRSAIETQIRRRIVGQDAVVEAMLVALFARGHCLFVGVPGLAKTLLVTSTAQALGLQSGRIQFTPDLMPADITGTDVLEEDRSTGRREMRFVPGPIFTNLLLADEVNRTPPRTQAALLQAMQENRVTAGGRTWPLEAPFLVFATQNPIEQEGTYPLPEAQLDRFMLAIEVGYPTEAEEVRIATLSMRDEGPPPEPVLDRATLVAMQRLVRSVPGNDSVIQAAVRLARATRPGPDAPEVVRSYVQWGAGPRASQFLLIAAQALAALRGKSSFDKEELRVVAPWVLRHRVLVNFAAEAEGITPAEVVNRLVEQVLKK